MQHDWAVEVSDKSGSIGGTEIVTGDYLTVLDDDGRKVYWTGTFTELKDWAGY